MFVDVVGKINRRAVPWTNGIFYVIPNGNDRTTNPAHKLFARQRHSAAANTGVAVSSLSSSFSVCLGTAP